MAKVVICPACQSKGSIPDGAAAARIRCPKCGQTFDVKSATQSSPSTTGTVKRPSAAPKRPAAARRGVLRSRERSAAGAGRRLGFPPAPAGFGPAAAGLRAIVDARGRPGYRRAGRRTLDRHPGRRHVAGWRRQAPGGRQANTAPPPEPVVQPAAPRPAAPAARSSRRPVAAADSSSSQAIDHAEVVRRLKEATVYIKTQGCGQDPRRQARAL